MSFDTDNLAERFDRVFDTPQPPSTIDPERLLEEGRGMARHRRTTRISLATAVGLACALAASHLPLGSPSRPGPATHTMTAQSNDPLVIAANFGWLPGPTGWTQYTADNRHGRNTVSVTRQWTSGHVPVTEALLWDPSPGPTATGHASVGTVNDRPAYLTNGVLYFQSPSGRWATLYTLAYPTSDSSGDTGYIPVATQLEIAQAVRFAQQPIALPIQIADAAATTAMTTYTTQTAGSWTMVMEFPAGSIDVTIDVQPGTPPRLGRILPGAGTFGGGPVQASEQSNGLGITVGTSGPLGTAAGNPGAYLALITSLGPNQTNWTTQPIVN